MTFPDCFYFRLPFMENNSLDEVGEYNETTSPEDVEGEEVLNTVLQTGKSKGKKKKRKKKCIG